ncbi:MAG: rRNA pseudouridine synthase [Acidaminococcaceae bacterium]|nr:rRNA pseudouridine synthase [Acidaminococcaceae bacterium]
MEELQRLQKVMAAHGIASRRECEKIILAGRVKVNNKIITELGTKVGPKDFVTVDGKGLKPAGKRYILMYKPRGVVSTMKDPQGRKTVAEMLKDLQERLYPVGRLDYSTEGLLLLTNDGALTQKLTHPSKEINKTYAVEADGLITEEKLDLLRMGVPLEDGLTAPAFVELQSIDKEKNTSKFQVTIHEGRNRQVRRMCDFIGFPVRNLKRIKLANLTLDGMKRGTFRDLTQEELKELFKVVNKNE